VRRADRLFSIIQILRGRRRAVTAKTIAQELEVSERTVYRDVRDLIASGTPIEGAAGVGYSLRAGYDLPPLMFDHDEIEALVLGARVVAAYGDEKLARAAASVLSKVEAVLPKKLKAKIAENALYALSFDDERTNKQALHAVRAALANKEKLRVRYARADGEASDRVVRPLGAFFWGRTWTLVAWCELRDDFRNFRLDRAQEITTTGERFLDEPGKTLRDYLKTIGPEAERILDA
jgi:predicted DNA-binding transcriptional regulator YafY